MLSLIIIIPVSCREGFNLKPGTMKVKAQPKKLKGTAVYELPLQLKKIEKTEKNHGGHH